jgi:hypothetical protein
LVSELTELRSALSFGDRHRVGERLAGSGALRLVRDGLRLGLEAVVSALDRGHHQLAVLRLVTIGRLRSNSISTPAARARSTSASVNRMGGAP